MRGRRCLLRLSIQLARIELLGIAAMDAPEEHGEGVAAFGDDDPVNVVCHQTVGVNAYASVGEVVADEVEIGLAVFGRKEDRLTIVASLCDVVRPSREHEASVAWHLMWEVRSNDGIARSRMRGIAGSRAGTVVT